MGQFDTSVEDAAMEKIFVSSDETVMDDFLDKLTPEQKAALIAKLLGK